MKQSTKLKVIFFGSSEYCIPVLEQLNNHFNLVTIVTKKNQVVEKFAQSHNIKVFTPKDKTELLKLMEQIRQVHPVLAVVADYGLIIPEEIFDLPKSKTLNIHFSKLPKLRGPSPVQFTILTGEKAAWISIIIMSEKMDTGDIIWQKEVPTDGTEIAESLYKKLFNFAASDLPDVINKYVQDKLTAQKQDDTKATYTKFLTREDGYIPPQLLDSALNGINFSKDQIDRWSLAKYLFSQLPITNYQLPILIERVIRALSPWPGVWTEITLRHLGWRAKHSSEVEESGITYKKRLKILKAHLKRPTTNDQRPTILVPNLVQLEGKKTVSWNQFITGYPNFSF